MARDVIARLRDPSVIALCIPADAWPRSVLGEQPIPDAWMGLLEHADGRRRLAPAGEDPRPRGGDQLTLVRNRNIAVELPETDAAASCGDPVSLRCEVLLRWPPREADLSALRRSIPHDVLTAAELPRMLERYGAGEALRAFVRDHPAEKLVRDDQREPLLAHLRRALERFAFETGAAVESLGAVQFQSASFERRESERRAAAERIERLRAREGVDAAASAAARRRLSEASDVLARLQPADADGAAFGERLGERLSALDPAQRAALLENLWRLAPVQRTARFVVVVTDRACAWLSPDQPAQIARSITLPPALGGVRSVRFDAGADRLLLGAATGVWTISALDGSDPRPLALAGAGQPRTGFNASVIIGERLFATHSQLGCWSFPLGAGAGAAQKIVDPLSAGAARGAEGIRAAIRADDGQLVFAVDSSCFRCDARSLALVPLPPLPRSIRALASDGGAIFAATDDGHVFSHRPGIDDTWDVLHRFGGAAVESLAVRHPGGLTELIVPAGAQGVCGLYPEQQLVTRLMETPAPVRRAWACDDLLAALAHAYDRLFVLPAGRPGRAPLDVPIARMLGGAVQDATIVYDEKRHPAAGASAAANG